MPGTRRYVIPLLVVFALVGVVWAVIAIQGLEPRLGLDLKGGSSVTFVPTNPRGGEPTQEQLDTTVDIIRNRVNSKGVAESEVNLEGGNIVVSIPDVPNPDEVIDAVGTTAQLQFRPVKEVVGPSDPKYSQGDFKAVDCANPETYSTKDDPREGRHPLLPGRGPAGPRRQLGQAADGAGRPRRHRRRLRPAPAGHHRPGRGDHRRVGHRPQLQRPRRRPLRGAHRQGGLQPGWRPQAPDRHHPGRGRDQQPAGGRVDPVQPGHQRRQGRDHRPDPGRGREPGPADLLGRPAPQARPPEPHHRQRHPRGRLAAGRPDRRGRRAGPGVPVRARSTTAALAW